MFATNDIDSHPECIDPHPECIDSHSECIDSHPEGIDIVMPRKEDQFDVWPGFVNPPPGYGEVPFYWWMGDKLDKDRLAWQLDQLAGYAISGLQVNYAHGDEGGLQWGLTYPSDPTLFSDAWWELFSWFREEANKRGVSVSLSDYTLGMPGQGWYIDEILLEDPDICGAVMEHEIIDLLDDIFEVDIPANLISSVAFPHAGQCLEMNSAVDLPPEDTLAVDLPCVDLPAVDLLRQAADGKIRWSVPKGGSWRVINVFARRVPQSIDPMNPNSGRKVIEKFFQRFEEKGRALGSRGLNFFFSDELYFGVSGQLWNGRFAGEFLKRKGYDILPLLPALFADIGDITPKVKLDYSDVLVSLEEESYFQPVYQWHQDRGMIYGCDHGGRGRDVTEFGDYFRTQKWNQGPGNDQPCLQSDIIKNKVASSIAHMYERPRTWLEGFHSSGWGTTSAQVADAIFRNFAMGHNLLSLHGLYYSTHGGWWEWAPPCNHFHMPYFKHMKSLLKCTERLSYLLSQGVHHCDVAIIYPVAAAEAGMGGADAVATAFAIGEQLYRNGIDFDFIDFQSLERARVEDGVLHVSGECFKVIVLPDMQAVRFDMFGKLLDFFHSGGVVVASGALPAASDRAGRGDAVLDGMVFDLFGTTARDSSMLKHVVRHDNQAHGRSFIVREPSQAVRIIEEEVGRDFKLTEGEPKAEVFFQHRIIGKRHVYLVYGVPQGSSCYFRAIGKVWFWNPWTGESVACNDAKCINDGILVRMPLGSDEVHLVVIDPEQPPMTAEIIMENTERTLLEGPWAFEIEPTLDNRWGDYRLPASDSRLGAEVHRLSYAVSASGDVPADDDPWETVTVSQGPGFFKLGPIPPDMDLIVQPQLVSLIPVQTSRKVVAGEASFVWEPYVYSEHYGVPGDPGRQGYHGLKGLMHNEFIALGTMEYKLTDTVYTEEMAGGVYYLWSTVNSPTSLEAVVLAGRTRPATVWLNRKCQSNPVDVLKLEPGVNTLLLRYDHACKTYFILEKPGDCKSREQSFPLAMDWYKNPDVFRYDCKILDGHDVAFYKFNSPPGFREMEFCAYGTMKAWAAGVEMKVRLTDIEQDGLGHYSAAAEEPGAPGVPVIIAISGADGTYGGAAIPEPIRLICNIGEIDLGDWSHLDGLRSYSGGAWYRKTFRMPQCKYSTCLLNLGCVASSAEVHVNGRYAGEVSAPPWKVDVTDFVRPGDNQLEILVCNTMANYYSTIPTRYGGELASGLIGPVALETTTKLDARIDGEETQ